MKVILKLILILGLVSMAQAAVPPDRDSVVLDKPIVITDHLRAYEAHTATGKTIIYATNVGEDGRRMGGELPHTNGIHFKATTITGSSQPRIIVSSQNIEKHTKPAEMINGIPQCYWRGQIVSPVLVGNRLVCPDQSSPYSNSN